MKQRVNPTAELPWCTGLFCALACVAFLPAVAEVLQYDRAALNAGALWRVLTGHLTHWSRDHLAWDLLTFAVLASLAERNSRRRFLSCVLASSVLISAAVWLLRPDLTYYRGLSGIDTALFALVATTLFRNARLARDRPTMLIATTGLAALAAKTLFELSTGSSVFVGAAPDFEPLPLAHVVGGATGLLVALWPTFSRRPSTFTFHPKECAQ